MRKILFRGKCNEIGKYNGQWIEGFYAVDDEKPNIGLSTDHGVVGYFCEPESIGQYTGLIDKNGNKIFEGDIIEFPDHGNGGTKTGQIKYFDDETMFLIVYEENNCKPLGECFHGLQLEVIGNIHDKPELLEANE